MLIELENLNNTPIKELINKEESGIFEIKASMRWDYGENCNNFNKMEYIVVRAIASFLNTNGGILIIGLHDKTREVLGLENDYSTLSKNKKDRDGFGLRLNEIIDKYLQIIHRDYIKFEICEVNGKDLCKIFILKSDNPIFIFHEKEYEFVIRKENLTQKLNLKDTVNYCLSHFYQKTQEKLPELQILFKNEKAELTISKKNDEPTELIKEDFQKSFSSFFDPTEVQKKYYKKWVRIWNDWKKNELKARSIGFIVLNKGQAPATNIDIALYCSVQKECQFIPQSKMKIPNRPKEPKSEFDAYLPEFQLKYKSIEINGLRLDSFKNDPEINKENSFWTFKYKFETLKHRSQCFLEPIILFIPDNPKFKEINFRAKITVQEKTIIPDQDLNLILSD